MKIQILKKIFVRIQNFRSDEKMLNLKPVKNNAYKNRKQNIYKKTKKNQKKVKEKPKLTVCF